MATVLIATTRARDIQALGTAGQLTTESWSALHRLLEQRLGPGHAALLAEPVFNAAQGETDWYTDADGPVRLLSSLPAAEQGLARQVLDRLTSDTLALAAEMEASRSGADRFLGAMLRLTMQVPDETCIHVAGAQPVLAAWGHARSGAAAGSVVLGGERAVPRFPMAILPPPAAPAFAARRIGPALAAALLVSLLFLLSASYVVAADPFRWYAVAEPGCQPPDADMALRTDLAKAADRESELRLQLAQLSTDAGSRRLMCPPVQPAALSAPPPPRSADANRAQQRGAQHGKLTIILAWDDRNDLDLYVRCPAGGTIFYRQRTACGGTLDVDANSDQRTADVQPVENVFFGDPRPGTYQVLVDPYAMRVGRATPFRLTIQQDGRPDRVVTGVANNGQHMQEAASVTVDAAP